MYHHTYVYGRWRKILDMLITRYSIILEMAKKFVYAFSFLSTRRLNFFFFVNAFTYAEQNREKKGFSGKFNYECTNEEKPCGVAEDCYSDWNWNRKWLSRNVIYDFDQNKNHFSSETQKFHEKVPKIFCEC